MHGDTDSKKLAWGLVRYFDRLAEEVTGSRWHRTDAFQRGWFVKELGRWLTKDELEPGFVKTMIQEFFADLGAGVVRPGKIELWRAFLARKTSYYQRAERKLARKHMDSSKYWTGRTDAQRTAALQRPSILPTRRDVKERERGEAAAERLRRGLPPSREAVFPPRSPGVGI